MEIIKKFSSKKNHVILVKLNQRRMIIKRFKKDIKFKRELMVYQELANYQNLAPKLYSFDIDKMELYLQYIKGDTLLSFLEEAEDEKRFNDAVNIMIDLISWLDNFHQGKISNIKNPVIFDLNFNNFIISKNRIFGLDFEDVREGDSFSDYIKLLSMYLMYNPIKSGFKKRVLDQLLVYLNAKFNMCKTKILYQVSIEEANIMDRRAKYKKI